MDTQKQNDTVPKSYIIANPIYDTVFKRLMENERIAKFFLSTILGKQVVSVEVRPQEFTYKNETKQTKAKAKEKVEQDYSNIGYSIYRIDFMATIKTKTGNYRKILIEVQKSWDEDDLMRFRNYLGEQYKRKEIVDGKEIALPITTIYILGFPLADIETACLRVKRYYEDMIEGKKIEAKSPFIESLTHDSYVIQATRITDKRYKRKLDKLLSLFEQNHFFVAGSEVSKHYQLQSHDDDIQLITSVLHDMIANQKEREEIEKEAEALRIIDDLFGKKNREQKQMLEENAKTLEEKDKVIEEKNKAIEEKNKTIEERNKAIEENAKALGEIKKIIEEQAKQIEELKHILGSKK
ncbi:MAG: hypothetical protein LBS43_06200 [Prevotellaceae bacterium]|jgi:hypothetical protein|nr:hypothetical protein [Prevotellaceae bacterium]